jgi:hypothetical protein
LFQNKGEHKWDMPKGYESMCGPVTMVT